VRNGRTHLADGGVNMAVKIQGSLDEGRITFKQRSATQRDPVCGMEVEPARAAATSDHGGERYYFCSEECKQAFDANPGDFTGARPGASP
jgi:YHS domain-containing protein